VTRSEGQFFYTTERPHNKTGYGPTFHLSDPSDGGKPIPTLERAKELAEDCAAGKPNTAGYVKTTYGMVYI
jgi:hypothetical protein